MFRFRVLVAWARVRLEELEKGEPAEVVFRRQSLLDFLVHHHRCGKKGRSQNNSQFWQLIYWVERYRYCIGILT